MLELLADTLRQLHIAEARERLRLMNEGTMKTVPLQQVITQRKSSSTD